jgi:hypothetical protein
MAVEGARLWAQKLPVQYVAQAAVEIMLGHPLGEPEAQAEFIVEVFLALHSLYTSALLRRYFCNSHVGLRNVTSSTIPH